MTVPFLNCRVRHMINHNNAGRASPTSDAPTLTGNASSRPPYGLASRSKRSSTTANGTPSKQSLGGGQMANEELTIENIEFAVKSQIGRAPHWTMVRELTMNAIEAAAKASGAKTAHWTDRNLLRCTEGRHLEHWAWHGRVELKRATNLAWKWAKISVLMTILVLGPRSVPCPTIRSECASDPLKWTSERNHHRRRP